MMHRESYIRGVLDACDGLDLAAARNQLPALIERARVAEWRSIEDDPPPKDGTEIVLYGACRPRNSPSRYARDANIGWWSDGQWVTRVGGEICEATHWMPLPAPPAGLLPPAPGHTDLMISPEAIDEALSKESER